MVIGNGQEDELELDDENELKLELLELLLLELLKLWLLELELELIDDELLLELELD